MRIRFDTANRSFFTLLGVALLPYLLLGFFGCGVLTLTAHRVVTRGWDALSAGPGDLRPSVALFALVSGGTVAGVASLVRQLAATRRLTRRIGARRMPLPSDLADAVVEAGLGSRVDLVDDHEPFSFAYGFPRPRIVVSRGLLEALGPEELAAVLLHERHHVRNHDPLKVLLARVFASAFFYLPALRGLRARYSAASELAADRRAMARVGRGPLAGALYRVVRGSGWEELAAAAAIGGPELLDVRVEQLETGREPRVASVSRASAVTTVAALAFMSAALVAAIVGLGGMDAVRAAMMADHRQKDMGLGWHDLGWAVPAAGFVVYLLVRRRTRRFR